MAIKGPEFNAAIPGYDVGPIIGQGGSAIVRRAVETATGRDVAMKFAINGTLPGDTTNPFAHEIEIQRRLRHPNIVQVERSGVIEDSTTVHGARRHHFFVMPLATESFEDTIESAGGILRPDTVVPVMQEVGAGLSYAHRNGVLHRDIKPPNVLLVNGHYALTDFGNASTAHRLHTIHSVTIQPRVGTLGFAAPELFRGDGRRPSDVFSMGAMATRALTGSLPYVVSYGLDYLERLMVTPREWFEAHVAMTDTLEEMQPVIAQSVSLDPAVRQQNVDEFVDQLTEAHARGTAKQQKHKSHVDMGGRAGGRSGAERTPYGHTPQDPLLHGSTVNYEDDPTTPFHDGRTGPYDSADPTKPFHDGLTRPQDHYDGTTPFHDGRTVPVDRYGDAPVGDRRPTTPFHDGRTGPIPRSGRGRSVNGKQPSEHSEARKPYESSLLSRVGGGTISTLAFIALWAGAKYISADQDGESGKSGSSSAQPTDSMPPNFSCNVYGVAEDSSGVKLHVTLSSLYSKGLVVLGGGYAAAASPGPGPSNYTGGSYSATYTFKPNGPMHGETVLSVGTGINTGVSCRGKFKIGTEAPGDESFVSG